MSAVRNSLPRTAMSFDCGLRNLAVALVCVREGFAFPAEYRTFASAEETNDAFKARCLVYFLREAWQLLDARLLDVSLYLERTTRVKNVKRLGLMSTAQALSNTLSALETVWFTSTHAQPDIIAVEIQHNANADMKAVALAISVFFMKTMDCGTTEYAGVTGGQKLKLCAALGVNEGDGTAAKPVKKVSKKALAAAAKAASAAADAASARTLAQYISLGTSSGAPETLAVDEAAPIHVQLPPAEIEEVVDASDGDATALKASETTGMARTGSGWSRRGGRGGGRGRWTGGAAARALSAGPVASTKVKYEDNKRRTVLAMQRLCAFNTPGMIPPGLQALVTDHNIADALFQALWVLWEHWSPRVPARPRKRKHTSLETNTGVETTI
jgi:hypothetical protein